MIHQYLKTCVLSVCVAALCGGRAFGAFFWCSECRKPIWDEQWLSHCIESSHGDMMPEYFCCGRCSFERGRWWNTQWRKDEITNDGKKTIIVPVFENHVLSKHQRYGYTLWCPKCKKEIGVNSWIMHLYWDCKCYKEIYDFRGSGFAGNAFSSDPGEYSLKNFDPTKESFRCLLCEKGGKKVVLPLIFKYEHLRKEHPERLPERKYRCKICEGSEETFSEADLQKHNQEKHKEQYAIRFYCLICKEEREECYEAHMAERHNGQCPFCEEQFPEENRREHMKEKHGFPCPICDEQVDTFLDVHVCRQHPYFEGPCKCQKYRYDESGKWFFKPCDYPSYRVSGLAYLLHLLSDVHEVGPKNKNIKSLYAWCPLHDFMGPYEEVVEHAYSKHEGLFFHCKKCQQLDFDCNSEELHSQVKHDKTHWKCMECKNVFRYESEKEGERSEFRNDHLLGKHKDIYMECPAGCHDVVRIKGLGSHMRNKHHSYFWCSECKAYKEGNQWRHMKEIHNKYYCEMCKIWISDSLVHHKEKHEDCFFCCLCLLIGSFENRVRHIEKFHRNEKKKCACEEFLLWYEVEESWHVAKHLVFCPSCKKECPPEHMVTVHKCKKGVCKPTANINEKIWKWKCHPYSHCPLESQGCKFTDGKGKLDVKEMTKHMQRDHKCESFCWFSSSGVFNHVVACRNGPALCSLCKCVVDNRAPHWMNEHGCKEGCPIAIGQEGSKWHQPDCEKWTLARCLRCWCNGDRENATNVDRDHIFKRHLQGCGGECRLIQEQDSEGTVLIQHRGHSNVTEEFALQCWDVPEEEEKKAEAEEDKRANGDDIDYNPDAEWEYENEDNQEE